jgi:hypothetical protein
MAARISLGEVLIPRSTKLSYVLSHQCLQASDFGPAEASAFSETHGIKPKLAKV